MSNDRSAYSQERADGHFGQGKHPFREKRQVMLQSMKKTAPRSSNSPRLLAFVADLELEVDRLRKHGQFVQQEVRGTLKRIREQCADAARAGNKLPPLPDIWSGSQPACDTSWTTSYPMHCSTVMPTRTRGGCT